MSPSRQAECSPARIPWVPGLRAQGNGNVILSRTSSQTETCNNVAPRISSPHDSPAGMRRNHRPLTLERMEARTLLSASIGSLDTTFGSGGPGHYQLPRLQQQ